MESVDFVSYFTAGMGYAVATGNPKNVDENDLCGLNVAVETGTVEEEAINKTAKQCKADARKTSPSSPPSSRPTPPPLW